MMWFMAQSLHNWDYKNPLHVDVVDRYLRLMGDNTIPDEAPPGLESIYPPWVAGIDLPQSMRVTRAIMLTQRTILWGSKLCMPFTKTTNIKYIKHDFTGVDIRHIGVKNTLSPVFICP